jgi:hypothetical protein
MNTLIKQWFALPFNVQKKLAAQFKIKDYGTTENQLDFELKTKLPKGLLEEEVEQVEEIGETPVSTGKEPVIEAEKPAKTKAVRTKKSK